jgi:hypothetical protein
MPSRADTGTRSRKTPLSDYVQAHMDREGLSANQLAGRSRDPETGQRILVQWLLNLVQDRLTDKAPEIWRLRALAAGMATTASGVVEQAAYRDHFAAAKRLTAAQWLELDEVLEVPASDGSIVTVSVPADLPEEGRQKIRKWAEQMARDMSESE